MLDVSIIKCLSDNYSYLIRDKKTNLVGVIDPSEFSPVDSEIQKTYKKLQKTYKKLQKTTNNYKKTTKT